MPYSPNVVSAFHLRGTLRWTTVALAEVVRRTGEVRLKPDTTSDLALIAAAALELISLVGKQHVEARQRSVTSADVALQLHLHIVRQVGGVHLLLERPQPVPHHDDLV